MLVASSRPARPRPPGHCSAAMAGFNRISAETLVTLAAGDEDLVRVAPPPVAGGENLHFVETTVAGGLDPGADEGNVDYAIAHHAAIEQQIGGRHQPVADMESEQGLVAGALDFSLQPRIPPDMVEVDRQSQALAQLVAQIVG